MFQNRSSPDRRDRSMIAKTISTLFKVMFETLGIFHFYFFLNFVVITHVSMNVC